MAEVALTPAVAPGTGATVAVTQASSLTATTNNHTFVNDGRTVLVCAKGASACTVTVATPATVRGVAVAEHTYTLAANTNYQLIGPFPPDVFNDSDGKVSIVFSETTGLIVGTIRLP